MKIIARRTLREFWESGHANAKGPLEAWYAEVKNADWKSMVDIKRLYAHASIVDSERVVFNIGGNKYRLVAKVWFAGKLVFIKFIGTHGEYDKVDVTKL